MFSAMRRRMRVSPATVIAGLALVFAMTSGAYAAKKYLITSTKQISPGVLKSLQGKAGAAGAQGAAGVAGVAGAQGPQGSAGPAGTKGETGPAGKEGAAGKAGATGLEGKTGKEGSPWGTGVLPHGKTETGVWGTGGGTPSGAHTFPISFPVPLANAPQPVLVPANKESEPGCPGRGGGKFEDGYVPTIPMAEEGKLCVYVTTIEQAEPGGTPFATYKYSAEFNEFEFTPGASSAGTLLSMDCTGGCYAAGTWAVTAE